ncbi:hypothetical protein HHK36_014589 [Tetracentron sinense]|uniref:Pentatricopeptide repeat-containing protein n=1 Tax=Tetracentron sinense TaxID=13715 RepID=A0A835DD20_TETSI|nr:hypothetical protein HHK36_014589 [Tetracentron sinense]
MRNMPFEPSARAWGSLLSGCRACGDLECAEELFRLEPKSASNHVLLANMYAANGRWEEMGRIRGLMKEKGLKKESGYSWIEVGKDIMILDFNLIYPSGTATAHLINSFHTRQGAKLA